MMKLLASGEGRDVNRLLVTESIEGPKNEELAIYRQLVQGKKDRNRK